MSVPFERTGVFATQTEIDVIKSLANAPLMAMTNPAPPGPGVSPVVPMFQSPIEAAHRYAMEHGLPDFSGYYGIDTATGEFLKPLE
jgi:hypothetical protein